MTTMIDVPRLRKELEFITAHPERWNQSAWIQRTECGTTGCLAGNTVLHAGYQPLFGHGLVRPDQAAHVRRLDGDGEQLVDDVAQRLLGLTDREASELFHPLNTLHDLWWVAADLTDGELQVPADVAPGYHDRFR